MGLGPKYYWNFGNRNAAYLLTIWVGRFVCLIVSIKADLMLLNHAAFVMNELPSVNKVVTSNKIPVSDGGTGLFQGLLVNETNNSPGIIDYVERLPRGHACSIDCVPTQFIPAIRLSTIVLCEPSPTA